jgi:hypothetical protein
MKLSIDGVKKVVREIYSEPNGGGLSWGRVTATFTVMAAIGWVTRVLLTTHALPVDMTGLSAFAISPYAANKVATAAQSFSSNPIATPPAALGDGKGTIGQ